MVPEFTINYVAVIACVVAGMPVGYLWFGPLFGKPWARHVTWDLPTCSRPAEARWRSPWPCMRLDPF